MEYQIKTWKQHNFIRKIERKVIFLLNFYIFLILKDCWGPHLTLSRAACGPRAACLRCLIYTILCVVCLTTTCFKNTRFRTAAHPLNNNQRFLFLLVCKNMGYDVQTLLLQKLSTIITQKPKKRKITEAGKDNLNF